MATKAVTKRRFHVDEYYRMVFAGILKEDDRIELIKGEIVEMPPIGSNHASIVDKLNARFTRALTEETALVRVQGPVRLSDLSEPVPDIAIQRPRPDYYRDSHPGPVDVLLLVEVADSSVTFNKKTKVPLYARARIPEVWVVDTSSSTIDVYSGPSPRGYTLTQTFAAGSGAEIEAPGGVRIAIDEIFA